MISDHRFRITTEWPRTPLPGEKDIAAIGLSLGGRSLTRLVDVENNTTRDYVRASAVALAIWFADNWWRLRWEPIQDYRAPSVDWRLRHELTSAPGGQIWPPLMVYGVGERVVIAQLASTNEHLGPIQYLPTTVSLMSSSDFEIGVDTFFEAVLNSCARALDADALKLLVTQLEQERSDDKISAWRRLEARLGYDPDHAPDSLIESLALFEERIGTDALEEAAVAAPGELSATALKAALDASETSEARVNLQVAAEVQNLHQGSMPLSSPWMLAEEAARQMRSAIAMTHGPILNHSLADILRVDWTKISKAPATARKLPYATRLHGHGDTAQVALQSVQSHDRRF